MSCIDQLVEGIETASASETEDWAAKLAPLIPENRVLAMHGDLGAGKTTFIKGLAKAWGISEPVTSPTFNLYTVYEGSRQLIHLDAYRLGSADDLDALMIQDFMRSPWCFAVEWPEHIEGALPDNAWRLHLDISASGKHRVRLVRNT
ncbi:MAG: tRNA (adenosine(37)-N6)-threonylcarbamoyltransferase complex ATPase subunit type 1 TsaE [Verrucomicrobiota bacterium]